MNLPSAPTARIYPLQQFATTANKYRIPHLNDDSVAMQTSVTVFALFGEIVVKDGRRDCVVIKSGSGKSDDAAGGCGRQPTLVGVKLKHDEQ